MTSIQPTGQRPFRGAQEMTLRLSGVDGLLDGTDPISLPSDAGQRVLADGTVRLLAGGDSGDGESPFDAMPPDATPFDATPFLASDAFVQADHATLRGHAATVIGETTDPWEQALKLHEWVFTHIDKVAVLSIPSALEVLAERRGDCNEHTVLFTALARAVGIPTKIAIGVVWSDDLDGFYYHAWPEVHVEGRWRRMDPTLDQPLADATHLKLLEGGIEAWPRLLPYLGHLEIEVLSIGRGPSPEPKTSEAR
jgi:transglutaminase-like putative cysteine protease